MKEVKQQNKVLRPFDGTNTGDDWHSCSSHYSNNDIELIEDPSGATDKKQITSIPSPFARIHIVEDAFLKMIVQAQNLKTMEGQTIYHKLVSDALDVGETFFNYDVFSINDTKLDIINWNKKKALDDLKRGVVEHQILGDTLELFLNQDGHSSNFDKLENLYFLKYDHKIVGGTSPTTLFFTCPNDLTFVNLKKGEDTFFDDDYYPLYKRRDDFQEYLYKLFIANNALQSSMPVFWKYLLESLRCLEEHNKPLYYDLMKIRNNPNYSSEDFMEDYEEANLGTSNDIIEIFPNIEHRKKRKDDVNFSDSDFIIGNYDKGTEANSKYQGKLPFVLQNKFRKALKYCHGTWNSETEVPSYVSEPLDARLLPGQSEVYPWLTISDFLEDTIIKLVYPIDKKHFFNGNPVGFFEGDYATNDFPEHSFLLPLKKKFFEFFDTTDLTKKIGGKPAFSLIKIGSDAVKVELRIPIKGKNEVIVFERLYKPNAEPNQEKNEGAVVESRINLGFMPLWNVTNKKEQRVVLIDSDTFGDALSYDYSLNFYPQNTTASVTIGQKTVRSDKRVHRHYATTSYYVVNDAYDYIELSCSEDFRGIIVPLFKPVVKGSRDFTFSIDFGTTNSHIEYSEGGKPPQPFEITDEEFQLISLADKYWGIPLSQELLDLFLHELIPFEVGSNQPYSFPMRTATSEISNLNHSQSTIPLGDVNIPFTYQIRSSLVNETITTNLKWLRVTNEVGGASNNRVEAFLSELMLLLRYKVLINGGDLDQTKLVWFHPASMGEYQVGIYRKIWARLFEQYITSKKENLYNFSESEAPFHGYGGKVKSEVHPVVNIDIGGGTTDVILFKDSKPKFYTSFKFAGNSVFGEGLADNTKGQNGFVKVFKPIVENFLRQNSESLPNLSAVFSQLTGSHDTDSADIMSFFFSIENNSEFKKAKLSFSFNDFLEQDEDLKVIFLIFYSSIIYHVAKGMKVLRLDMPRNICLSGNGSRIVNLLDPDKNLSNVERFTKLLFEKVYGEDYHKAGLELYQDEKPKEVTSKGGIKMIQNKVDLNTKFDKIVLLGDANDTLINETAYNYDKLTMKYDQLAVNASSDTDGSNKEVVSIDEVVKEVEDFIDMIFDLHHDFSFQRFFGIKTGNLKEYKEVLKRDLKGDLMKGLKLKKDVSNLNDTECIAETLFFYPLVSGIYKLTNYIANKK
jgi:hypothetical protein